MIVRQIFYWSLPVLIGLGLVLEYYQAPLLHVYWTLFMIYALIGLYDVRSKHAVLRNYPVIGTFRYLFESIRPEIQQYFVATNLSERPFNREQRSLVYMRAKDISDTHPFGTEHDITEPGYDFALHSLNPTVYDETDKHIQLGNHQCKKPYHSSRLNISAMSYGALSNTAVEALNLGAKLGGFAQNTGEGGLTDHHLKHGGDLGLHIGTGYFSMRNPDGTFSPERFQERAANHAVKFVEIKLSQGAKPSHGGVLPQGKISDEIAKIRLITQDQDCISPPTHSAFHTPLELMAFITQLRELSGGLPVGFKLCLGAHHEFMSICKAMLETNVYPDFITIDGAEGGTGAAPIEFSNRLGTPIDEALAFVHNTLVGLNIREHIRLIVAGKIVSGFDVLMKLALGADICNMARPMMFAVGCIQSLRCNENTCPTGVATSNPKRASALKPQTKGPHVANFHRNTLHSFAELAGAMGVQRVSELHPELLRHRKNETHSISFDIFSNYIKPGTILDESAPYLYMKPWKACTSASFSLHPHNTHSTSR